MSKQIASLGWSTLRQAMIGLAVLVTLALGSIAPAAAKAERRVALVIGNAAYQHATPLKNPIRDAEKVSATLRTLDFDVTVVTDADKIAMEQALRRFSVQLEGADVALFYYSGHAVQVGDQNYVVPVSAMLDGPRNLVLDTIALQDISSIMQYAGPKVQLLFLDACRNNPFSQSLSAAQNMGASRGLAPIQTPGGALVVFSTSPGQEALDGTGSLSPFTDAFTRYAVMPKLEIRQVLSRVRADVASSTDQRQVPWDNSSMLGDFYLVPNRPPPLFEHLIRTTVQGGTQPQPLGLKEPTQPEGGALDIALTSLPSAGHLLVGSNEVLVGDKMKPAEFAKLAYQARAVSAADTFGFKVDDAWGNSDSGVVVVQREQAPATVPMAAARPLGALQASAVSLLGLGPNLIFKTSPQIGQNTGPNRVRLASNLPFGQIVLGDRVIEEGRSVEASDVVNLAFNPPAGSEGKHLDATFVAEGENPGEIKVGIDVALTECDRLAGDRLDLQGVAEGILSGQIDTKAALPACENAVKARPSVGRFTYQLGRVYAALGRDAESAEMFHKAADLGHTRALWALGNRDETVQPVNFERGKTTLERAAAAGDIYAVHSLGNLYYEGRGVPQDLAKARSLFETSARMGHTFSMNTLGRMYQRGEAVATDLGMTRRYWSESAARGDLYGVNNMGFVYLEGIDGEKDTSKAIEYFKRASELGHPEAPNNIGRLYALGLGVPVDYAEARKWDTIGADRGDAWAAYNLGELYRQGNGGPADAVEAGYFYARAAAAINRLEPSKLAGQQLVGLDRKTKVAVLGRLLTDIEPASGKATEAALLASARRMSAARGIKVTDGSLDGLVVAAAQCVWIARNKRADLF